MLSVHFPPSVNNEEVPFYLATEEYLAKYTNLECFFMWQVSPSVIIGRNQLMANEVNIEFCKKNNIQVYRRKSGGGCVYADKGNVMLSYIGTGKNIQTSFKHYVGKIVSVLSALNLPSVEQSGRNDILLDGKKISGNAFYHVNNRNVIHGTLLYDTNMEHMIGSITPDSRKLETKGIKSVSQRIGLLKDYYHGDLNLLKSYIKTGVTAGQIVLTDSDLKEIRKIEQEYLSLDFLYGNDPICNLSKNFYKKGCGNINIRVLIKHHYINGIELSGDFLEIGDIEKYVIQPLINIPYSKESIYERFKHIDVEKHILNLTNEEFIKLLI